MVFFNNVTDYPKLPQTSRKNRNSKNTTSERGLHVRVCKKDKKNQNRKNEKIEKTDKKEKTYMSLKAFRCFRRLFAGVTVFVASASSPLSVQIVNLAEAKASKKVNNKKKIGSKSSAPKKAHTKKETSKSSKTAKKTSKKPSKKAVKKAVKKPAKKTVKTVKTVKKSAKKPSNKAVKKTVKKTKTAGKRISKTAKTVKTAKAVKPVKTIKTKTDGKTFMYADARTAKIKITVHAPENGKLYAFNPEQYHKSDKTRGESKSVSKGTFVASYNSRGKTKVFERNRYSSAGKDYAYQKYYIVQGSKIIKGPVYVSELPRPNVLTHI